MLFRQQAWNWIIKHGSRDSALTIIAILCQENFSIRITEEMTTLFGLGIFEKQVFQLQCYNNTQKKNSKTPKITLKIQKKQSQKNKKQLQKYQKHKKITLKNTKNTKNNLKNNFIYSKSFSTILLQ